MTETLTTAVTGISAENQDWKRLKAAATALQPLQAQDQLGVPVLHLYAGSGFIGDS